MASRTRFLAIAVVLPSFLLLPLPNAPASEGRDKTIVTEGRGAGSDANAMEQAKQDALRRAVEEACGSFITSQTKTKNFTAIYDKAFSLAAGYVTEFEVLERRTAGGISYCKIRAKVSTVAFEKEWARLLHTIHAEGNPRCILVVVEDDNIDDTREPRTNGVAQGILENFFIDKGVQLMDKTASEDVRERDVSLAAINNDINKLAAAAAAFKADVFVRGVAEARRAGTSVMGGRTMYRWSASLSIRAYHADSAQMLMSNTFSTTKTNTNENAGGEAALRACAQENAGRILSEIGEAWRKRQNVRRTCQLVLENCSRRDFKAFESAMRKVQGVQDVRLKELVNSVCRIEIDWAYDLERLVDRIERLEVSGTSYEFTEQTHDRAVAKLVK